jgi:uncharacterized membrane protein YfcA
VSIAVALLVGLLIGGVLGALGGGGAILTVPALVYLLGQTAQDATTSSLVIVGVTAVAGALAHARAGRVRWRTGTAFGVAGILAAFAGTALNHRVDAHVLLLGFAGVMLVAATGMLLRARSDTKRADHPTTSTPRPAGPAGAATTVAPHPAALRSRRDTAIAVKVIGAGLAVGFLTGFFGVGGGFVIVPALVMVLGFPMPAAVGTSLLIIAVNSAASLAARAGHAHFDWAVIIPFTLAAMAATLAGKRIADRLPGTTLSRAFAGLLLAVAAYVAITSIAALN